MKLLEIKNNLVKMTYQSDEIVALGRFVALEDSARSYIGQIVNLKADIKANYAIAKLLFTVSEDGIIDTYDGTIPSLEAKLSNVDSSEIAGLIPVEKPIKFGNLSQQKTMLNIDQAFFETNSVICAEKFDNINIIVRNFADQIAQNKEKVVILDVDHTFGGEDLLRFKKDFRLPLDAKRIDYLINFELEGIEAASKAVIQDIFIEVKEYVDSLPDKFLPFENFLGVVSAQYEATKIPELALLKNRLMKYQSTFAQTKEEIYALKDLVMSNNPVYIDIEDESDNMQKELIGYVHEILQDIGSYVYMFVKLTNKNTDKLLLKELLESNSVFSTIVCSHNHKYIQEMKQRAQGIVLFAPQTVQHDFAAYNTFLSKLGAEEFVVYGGLTQDIPFIVELSDFSENYTEEYPTIPEENEEAPVIEETTEVSEVVPELSEEVTGDTEEEQIEPEENETIDFSEFESQYPIEEEPAEETINNVPEPESADEEPVIIEDVQEDDFSDEVIDQNLNDETILEAKDVTVPEIEQEPEELSHDQIVEQVAKDVDEMYYNKTEDIPSIDDVSEEEPLTENDLDFIDELPQINEAVVEETTAEVEETVVQEAPVEELPTEGLPETEPEEDTIQDEPVEEEVIVEEPVIEEVQTDYTEEEPAEEIAEEEIEEEVPVYPAEETEAEAENIPNFEQGDTVSHPKYGKGVIEKLIKYGNKTLCSISFENVGRRLLDPSMSELEKI